MSEYDRTKFYPKKKFFAGRETSRNLFNTKSDSIGFTKYSKESGKESNEPKKQPTILIKAREPTSEDAAASPKHVQKEDNASNNITIASSGKDNDATSNITFKKMTKSMKLIDDSVILTESLQDYMQDNNDFLVVGVVGAHGVGKSTILNLLAHDNINDDVKKRIFRTSKKNLSDDFKESVRILTDSLQNSKISNDEFTEKEIFQMENVKDIESNTNTTRGIDIFVTSNRLILLDCQPFMSVSVLEELVQSENKRSNLVSEFIPLENGGEIQGLQLTAFLMSICHVLLVVQDYFFDSNVIRYIHSAEMLKPTMSNPEDELVDHFPHLILLQNRAQMDDFTPKRFKVMQQLFKTLFQKTRLNIKSNLGLGGGRIINYLNPDNCGSAINLYMIPEIDIDEETMYRGHPPIEELIKRLKANILGSTKHPLSHVQLSEKTWLIYCAKVWDTVKKSSFFVEYTKLLP